MASGDIWSVEKGAGNAYNPAQDSDWEGIGDGTVPETLSQGLDILVANPGGGGDLSTAVLLNGRSTAQTVCGGTSAGAVLTLYGSSDTGNRGSVRITNLVAGDLQLKAVDDSAWWTLIEASDGIQAINHVTGQHLELSIRASKIGPIRRGWRWIVSHLPEWF